MTIADCGSVVDSELQFLATSDSWTCEPSLECFSPGACQEINAPTLVRTVTFKKCVQTMVSVVCLYEDGKVKLTKTHAHYFQVQGHMDITKRKWCDFVVWTMKDIQMYSHVMYIV